MRILSIFLCLLGYCGLQAQENITYAEWFIDKDPGFGQANKQTGIPQANTFEWDIELDNLPVGIHYLGTRAKTTTGIWTQTSVRSFIVLPVRRPTITSVEWFIDSDPGFGMANKIPVIDGILHWELNLQGLSTGVHYLGVRAKDQQGIWSMTHNSAFLATEDGAKPVTSIDYEYRIPGVDTISFSYRLSEPSFFTTLDFDANTTGLLNGQTYDLCFKAITADGKASSERCVTLEFQGVTSNEMLNAQVELNIYPNPATKLINIELRDLEFAQSINIIDTQGRPVLSRPLSLNDNLISLDVSKYARGYYSVIIETKEGLIIRPFLVQ